MSYDLAVWYADSMITSQEGTATYRALCDGEQTSAIAHKAIAEFLADLVRIHPEISSLHHADAEGSPWTHDFERSDAHVLLCMKWSWADKIWPAVARLASEHGLVCYNPQGNFALYPPKLQDLPHLRLQMENWTIIDDPTDVQIEAALQTLDDANSFAVLERQTSRFIQTRCQPGQGFSLEYKDDSTSHYYCGDANLDLAPVVEAFQSYASATFDWKDKFERLINALTGS